MDRATVPKPIADRLGDSLRSCSCFCCSCSWEGEEEFAVVSVAGDEDAERSAAGYNVNRGRGALAGRRAVRGVRKPRGVSRAMVKERHWAAPGLNGSLVLRKRGLKYK